MAAAAAEPTQSVDGACDTTWFFGKREHCHFLNLRHVSVRAVQL